MRHEFDDERSSMVERIVGRDLDEQSGVGRPLSERSRQTRRSVESYLKGGVCPRWMERVSEIDAGIARERRELARAYREWRALVLRWPFDELNVLIEQHNEWYPIERNLAVNPRTGEYVRVGGRSYRRPVLGPQWVLEQFAEPLHGDAA